MTLQAVNEYIEGLSQEWQAVIFGVSDQHIEGEDTVLIFVHENMPLPPFPWRLGIYRVRLAPLPSPHPHS